MILKANDDRPNILWFCTDQQRFDTINSLGNPYIRTPNLDKLVERGAAFTRAYLRQLYSKHVAYPFQRICKAALCCQFYLVKPAQIFSA